MGSTQHPQKITEEVQSSYYMLIWVVGKGQKRFFLIVSTFLDFFFVVVIVVLNSLTLFYHLRKRVLFDFL